MTPRATLRESFRVFSEVMDRYGTDWMGSGAFQEDADESGHRRQMIHFTLFNDTAAARRDYQENRVIIEKQILPRVTGRLKHEGWVYAGESPHPEYTDGVLYAWTRKGWDP
jgi:hypothetical protein